MVYFLRLSCLLLSAASTFSFTAQNSNQKKVLNQKKVEQVWGSSIAAAALGVSVVFGISEPALASKSAVQISLDALPPNTISIQIKDIPVVGNLVSGTYAKVDDKSVTGQPSIVIKSPSDKIGAIKSAVSKGHVEVDVNGILQTHLDVDIGAAKAGVANIRVASELIPPLPFKNAATSGEEITGKKTSWNIVTNLGSGKSYYYDGESGESTFKRPNL